MTGRDNTPNNRILRYIGLVLIIVYAIGLVGILLVPGKILPLTPFNLLLSLGALVYAAPHRNHQYIRFLIAIVVLGFAVELVGVKTGRIFGSYYYGETLGLKASGIPLIIGINWAILCICALSVTQSLAGRDLYKILAGAALMTSLDALIEPLCSTLDFWHWSEGSAPIKNFAAWFVVSLFFNALGRSLEFEKHNPLAKLVLILQIIFFAGLNLANKFI